MKYFPKWLQFILVVILVGPIINSIDYLEETYNVDPYISIGILVFSVFSFYLYLWIKDMKQKVKDENQNYLKNYFNKYMYSQKEFDRAFSMLWDLKKGKKPGFFTYPHYKSLYNHPMKFRIISEYDKYFEDLPQMAESERKKRAIALTDYVFKQMP
ncbi:hypothetical protein [Aquiflexum sp.]|uniref:hypothetical protein n=1 Tax=Aquiflexum sp. TaxID=1872584 RepID=UPI0035937562